ncbi:hypothetical protein BO78DRAFT_399962 [Aspergillus sclerotiicarbonarius CBS 121057]|uniref:Uncharacterized protein n=1 Tax=Aspergillus sclerotiicarbonarius (strain CBS 121057 / IBT 28362) TaxID=1448318 RepID=A0A319FAW9_ASPSB|nr:hypothetical protein BO78DRAFT_399962 [Aspergillus sclerotiicarbonarius CBS 121057]
MNSPSANDEVTIAFTVAVSLPILSLSSSTVLKVFVRPRIVRSSRPGQPITLLVNDSAFEASEPGGWQKAVAFGSLGQGLESKNDRNRVISFGILRPHYPEPYYDLTSLHGRGRFLTLPGSGEDVVITHEITMKRLFERSRLRPEDIQPGEEFQIQVSRGGREIGWWCWGDLDGDLKGKNLHPWVQGYEGPNTWYHRPSQEEIERENHVTGGDPENLLVEDHTHWVDIKIVQGDPEKPRVEGETNAVDVKGVGGFQSPALHPR